MVIMSKRVSDKNYGYIKYPLAFPSYRWYKPLLVALLGTIFYFILAGILTGVCLVWYGTDNMQDLLVNVETIYESMDTYSGPGALLSLGTLAVMIPSLFFATLIVRDRPFSSYSSSVGGWRPGLFVKCLLLAAAAYGAAFGINVIVDPGSIASEGILFDVPGFVVLTIILPFQCMAEEYIFRGFLMQTFGAWFRLPVLAIILQSVIFAIGHSYNLTGVIAIFISGIIFGILGHFTKGLEASSAVHIIGNYLSFYITGFGLDRATSEIDLPSLLVSVITDAAFAAAVILLGKKFGWFKGARR